MAAAGARITIGRAVADLKAEFPDVDIKESKIRHLEAEGLVEPERTPSGYRKYSVADMEKLRYIIRAQREHYLPLKVIKEHLDALDRGLQPPTLSSAPTVPGEILDDPTQALATLPVVSREVRISRRELLETAEIDAALLDQLESYGLIVTRAGSRDFDGDALRVAKVAGELAAFGLEPRHLRSFKTAADREVGLIEQVVAPIRSSRDDDAEGRAAEVVDEMAVLSVRLHAALVRAALRRGR